MVKSDLNETMITLGADLLQQLDRAHFPVVAALWLYQEETNGWRLLIASPEVRTKGPQASYRKVRETLRRVPGASDVFALSDITLLKDSDPFIAALGRALKTGRRTGGVRFARNAVDGHYIEDAYIYRIRWESSARRAASQRLGRGAASR